MDYSVKNVKEFQGMEGTGFSCSLYLDNKKIGTVTDTANGGMIDFYLNNGEEKTLDDYCKTLPKVDSMLIIDDEDDGMVENDKDIFVTSLIDKWKETKQVKKWCKTKIVFKTDEQKEGQYLTIPVNFTPQLATQLKNEYEGKGLVIMNETL